jgi:amino acid adenylation domain-containing protein
MTDRFPTLGVMTAATARAWPDRLAAIDEREQLDYRTLDATAAAWAAALTERTGLRAGDVAVLSMPRSARLIVAFHALSRLGCTIVPVSHDIPEARLAYIVGNADASAVLVDTAGDSGGGAPAPDLGDTPVLDIATLSAPSAAPPAEAPDPATVAIASGRPAYIIYTSGTTGDPKGVATGHDAILCRYHDWNAAFGLDRRPMRILQTSKPGFDLFVGDLVKAFGSGGTLVMCPDMAILQPDELTRWLTGYSIDYVDTVPAVLRALVEHFRAVGGDLSGLAMFNCGADFWTRGEYLQAKETLRIGRLFNGYGVTECAVESIVFEDDGLLLRDRDTLPIGRPLASERVLVVDESLRPVPDGTIGQLCLGGPGVAMGYIKDPERNARAFVVLPEAPDAGRVYLTGDLARVAPDGQIEFHGRNDTQIKIRGNRIEIHEIERVLERHPDVRQAVVHFDPERVGLHAFVLMADGARFDREALAAFAATWLPAYMRPGEILAVAEIALNRNNKVDRKALFLSTRRDPAIQRVPDAETLGGCRDPETLLAAFAASDLDLVSLVAEFVKPAARRTILARRPAATAKGHGRPALQLEIVVDDGRALKKAHAELYGHPVVARPGMVPDERVIEIAMGGLDIRCLFRPRTNAAPAADADDLWVIHDDGPSAD